MAQIQAMRERERKKEKQRGNKEEKTRLLKKEKGGPVKAEDETSDAEPRVWPRAACVALFYEPEGEED